MNRFLSLSLTTLVAIVAMVATSAYANAQAMRWNPLINDIVKEAAVVEDGAIIKVQRRRRGNRNYNRGGRNRNYNRGGRNRNYNRGGRRYSYNRGRHGARYRHRNGRYRHNYNGYWYAVPFWLGAAAVVGSSDNYVERPVGNAHVNWCFNRYRSYNARTDTYRGYDGYNHRCRSPYRR